MEILYILIFLAFSSSYQYKIIDLEAYKYTYYVNDLEDNIVIYKFQPKSKEKEIFISFLGNSDSKSFEFYLYSTISDINSEIDGNFKKYLEKFIDYGETAIKHNLDIYYILVKMNSYRDEYKYLSFMMYNIKEYLDIGKYNEYILLFEESKNIILNYNAKNINQYLYIESKGNCEFISYYIYKNNTRPELIEEINNRCILIQKFITLFNESDNYYINMTINTNKIVRIVLYYLNNNKYIIPVKDVLTDINYGYLSLHGVNIEVPDYKFFFINIENVPDGQLFGYHIFEQFNSNNYKIGLKYYEDYNISEMPYGYDIKDYYYVDRWDKKMREEPFIFLRKYSGIKGLLLKIESLIDRDDGEGMYNEMIIYLHSKNIIEITENKVLNSSKLIPKNVYYLKSDITNNLIIKTNLDYFTILNPKMEIIKSKGYLFNFKKYSYIMQFQNKENAFVEMRFVNDSKILKPNSPEFMFLCKDNTYEEKYIYLPYMTYFNILYGDIEIYDINITSLNNLDDFYNENYMKNYSSIKRYNDYSKFKEEQYFYKIKCTKNSLIKYENSFISYIDENITMNSQNKKLILDFSKFIKKTITFKLDLPLYIGILESPELKEDWTLNFTLNNIRHFINNKNDIFFKEVKINDILIIEKPDKNIHVYIKTFNNYSIGTFKPSSIKSPGLYIFDKNVKDEYDTLIYLTEYDNDSKGKYSLFYGNPKNYEYNELINYEMEISNNPYKYLKVDDINKYFFLIYENYSYNSEMKIIKINQSKMILNKLIFVENNYNEIMRIKLPIAIDDHKIAFIQYIDEKIEIFSEKNKNKELYYGKDFKIYEIRKNKEYYADNEKRNAYKSYYFISYMNNNTYDYKKIEYDCNFHIENISITDKNVTIDFINNCSSTMYNYTIFIEYNINNYKQYSPIKKYYEKGINNNTKYYEFQRNGTKNTFEIVDSIKREMILITIVGQDTEGFHRFVYTNHQYDNTEKKEKEKPEEKSYLKIIIIASIIGAILIIVIIICIAKKRKKYINEILEEEKTMELNKQEKEKENADFKKYERSADCEYEIKENSAINYDENENDDYKYLELNRIKKS